MLGRKGDTCVLIKSKDDESAFLKELELRAAAHRGRRMSSSAHSQTVCANP